MEKQPFTPSGVLALKDWLYQLPTVQFDAELLAMNNNFEAWSLAHLELNTQQIEFYNQLSGIAKNNIAYNVTLAATFKKPISLVQSLLRDSGDDPVDKLFKINSSLAITSDNEGSEEVEGEAVIEVTYIN